jgi:hypothetical protein
MTTLRVNKPLVSGTIHCRLGRWSLSVARRGNAFGRKNFRRWWVGERRDPQVTAVKHALAADSPQNLDARTVASLLRGVAHRIADGVKVISAGTRMGPPLLRSMPRDDGVAS